MTGKGILYSMNIVSLYKLHLFTHHYIVDYYYIIIMNKLFQSWKRYPKQNRQVVNEDKYK